jgi:transcription initiation factor TFIIE subunit alpha
VPAHIDKDAAASAVKLPTTATMKDPIETAKQLVRTIVRMFYEIEHVVVMDALCYHGALPISDLVLVLDAGKNSKHVGKIVGKLKEAGMCAV